MQRRGRWQMKKLIVKSSKTYQIILSKALLDEAGKYIASVVSGKNIYVITDDIVDSLYFTILEISLIDSGFNVFKYVIPNGEKSKNSSNYISILNDMADKDISKTDTVIALGGGVPGDLAGFVAATYLRGINLVQMPTTLLAAVDSSVGGKTAIDLDKGKNLAGAFYQPNMVLCDLSLMDTLSDQVFNDGCAEVIKYGIIGGEPLFEKLAKPIKLQLEDIVYSCVKMKRDIVQQDELDTNIRHILNFGHTVGHAIELLSNYEISHGTAVAKGMSVITKASYNLGLCNESTVIQIDSLISSYGFDLNPIFNPTDLAKAILMDKKRNNDYINLVLVKEIGQCVIKKTNMSELTNILQKAIG